MTRHPTAAWLARQITEAFPWASAPAYLVRDNDRAYGHVFTSRVRAMGIRDRRISPGSPWQNGIAERFIGTLRRECLDHMAIFGEAHLRGEFFPPMQRITIKREHIWLYRKTHRYNGLPNGLDGSPRFPSWPGYITNMIFGKDKAIAIDEFGAAADQHCIGADRVLGNDRGAGPGR